MVSVKLKKMIINNYLKDVFRIPNYFSIIYGQIGSKLFVILNTKPKSECVY